MAVVKRKHKHSLLGVKVKLVDYVILPSIKCTSDLNVSVPVEKALSYCTAGSLLNYLICFDRTVYVYISVSEIVIH